MAKQSFVYSVQYRYLLVPKDRKVIRLICEIRVRSRSRQPDAVCHISLDSELLELLGCDEDKIFDHTEESLRSWEFSEWQAVTSYAPQTNQEICESLRNEEINNQEKLLRILRGNAGNKPKEGVTIEFSVP